MLVVSDTTPLIYIILIGHGEILPALFGRITVPAGVIAELGHAGGPEVVRRWVMAPPCWLSLESVERIDPRLSLGRGESEAISLALERRADLLLIDERRGSDAARSCGLKTTGTLGTLRIAAEQGLIDLPTSMKALLGTSFRAPAELIRELLDRDAKRRGE